MEIPNLYVGKIEITQDEWETYMRYYYAKEKGKEPKIEVMADVNFVGHSSGKVGAPTSHYGLSHDKIYKEKDTIDFPVYAISYYEAIIYCNTLSTMNGLTPCYSIGPTTDLSKFEATSPVWKRIVCNFTANGFRLPTEAEWEFAAREGKALNSNLYSGSANINSVAWYGENSGITSHNVATKDPNSLQLYDMCGNVAEWCWDYYSVNLVSGSQTNPHGPTIGEMHVKRGGSWLDDPQQCTVFYRSGSAPNGKSSSLGFRVCQTILMEQQN